MPEVPTVAELGMPTSQYQFSVGAFAQAQTLKPIIERINREIVAALNVREIADKLLAPGSIPMSMTTDEFGTLCERKSPSTQKIVKASGYQPQ
jgi:tripartite-type tricarboxylate transporter receptor subunit TctC